MESASLRLQGFAVGDQLLVLGRLAEGRSETGRFAPAAIDALFDEFGLPRPAKVSNVLVTLEKRELVSRPKRTKGVWRLTPTGRHRSVELMDDMSLMALSAEAMTDSPVIGRVSHPVLPPWLAPPDILPALHEFLDEYPFDTNVFGMTRFPDEQDEAPPDPVAQGLQEAADACAAHGLQLHLASHRNIVDDLWSNVAAHMWACRYGIGFFEDRRGRGVNYNLSIEVGGMLTTGRRVALLKDDSIDSMPTDLVGKIYTSVDLEKAGKVSDAVHAWLRNDLRLGACSACP